MSVDYIEEFLNRRIWAVVGVSQNTQKFGYKIYKSMLGSGYTVYPIHPAAEEVDGNKVYKSLAELPQKPEVVNLVVPPNVSEKVVEECKELGIERVWFQPGAESPEAIAKAESLGLKVVYNACAMALRKNL